MGAVLSTCRQSESDGLEFCDDNDCSFDHVALSCVTVNYTKSEELVVDD